MNKVSAIIILFVLSLGKYNSQIKFKPFSHPMLKEFNESAAYELIKAKNISSEEGELYLDYLKRNFIAEKYPDFSFQGAENQLAKNIKGNVNFGNAYCQNLGFENYDFMNWQAGTWSIGGVHSWSVTPVWVNGTISSSNNASLLNPQARHTICTLPPVSNGTIPNGPWIGWDSLAISPITLTSDIPIVCPNGNGVSVRLGNANWGGETEYIKYSINVNSSNQILTYHTAIVLCDGGHTNTEQSFFQVKMTDMFNNSILAGCGGQYQIDATQATIDTSFIRSAANQFILYYYRPWRTVTLDLSPFMGQTVNLEFRTGDCALGGHFGYAYIDASCGPLEATVNGFCNGSTKVDLVAPSGFSQFQWFGPNSLTVPILGANNDTLTLNNPNYGDIYWVQCVSAQGCTTLAQLYINNSSIKVNNIQVTNSCQNSTNGAITLSTTGGLPSGYNYLWTSGPNQSGTIVYNGPSNSVSGLIPGTYYVHITSGNCNSLDTSVQVGTIAPMLLNSTQTFCNNLAIVNAPLGAINIQWWDSLGYAVQSPIGIANTYTIANPKYGQKVYCVYENFYGCRDSLIITLNKIGIEGLSLSNIISSCSNNSNGQINLNISSYSKSPYDLNIIGSNGYSNSFLNYASNSLILNNLSSGTYSVSVLDDNNCFYVNEFSIDSINLPIVNATNLSYCKDNDTTEFVFNFVNDVPSNCALTEINCLSSSNVTIGTNQYQNSGWDWPAPYGNSMKNSRHQFLIMASELQAAGMSAGKINSLSFFVTNVNSAQAYPNFRIKVGCTSLNSLPDLSIINSPSSVFYKGELSQVYLYPGLYNPVLGINTHQFNQAYEWDGVSNLIIETCFDLHTTTTQNSSFELTFTPFVSSIVAYDNYNSLCGAPLDLSSFIPFNPIDPISGTQYLRPVMQFGWCTNQSLPNQYSYSWSPNTGFISSNQPVISPTDTVFASPSTSTIYTLTITDISSGCQTQEIFPINILSSISPLITTVVDTLYANVSADIYHWYLNGNLVSSGPDSSFVPMQIGMYSVIACDSNGCCSDTSMNFMFYPSGISNSEISGLAIYPNPANDKLQIESKELINSIQAYNVHGACVYKNLNDDMRKQIAIYLEKFSPGIYLFQVKVGDKIFNRKVMIEK